MTPWTFRLSPTQRVLAWRLLEPRRVSIDEYIFALYGDREDGGPLDPEGGIRVQMFLLKRKLEPYGIRVHVRYCFGWYVSPSDVPALRSLLAEELRHYHKFAPCPALDYHRRRLTALEAA